MREVFSADQRFRPVETPGALASTITDFEREFLARGVATLRSAFQLD
jgi:hypothetical protein